MIAVGVLDVSGVNVGGVYLIIVSLPSHCQLKFLSMNTTRPKNIQSFGVVEHLTTVALHDVAIEVPVPEITVGLAAHTTAWP